MPGSIRTFDPKGDGYFTGNSEVTESFISFICELILEESLPSIMES